MLDKILTVLIVTDLIVICKGNHQWVIVFVSGISVHFGCGKNNTKVDNYQIIYEKLLDIVFCKPLIISCV